MIPRADCLLALQRSLVVGSSQLSRTQLHGGNEVRRWKHIEQLLVYNVEVDVGACIAMLSSMAAQQIHATFQSCTARHDHAFRAHAL